MDIADSVLLAAVKLEAGDGVQLRVEDAGVGFLASNARPGRGLAGMRARAEPLGGSVEVNSSPGRGTAVSVFLPFDGSAT